MSFPLPWRSRRGLAAVLFQTLTAAPAALASQGPGAAYGTASASTQLTMAIIVYGGAALILAVALIGAIKRKLERSI
jgi:hypothetical protein